MNAGIAKAKHNDMKKLIDYALRNFRRSRNSDGGIKSSGTAIGDVIDEVFDDESADLLESFNECFKNGKFDCLFFRLFQLCEPQSYFVLLSHSFC